MEQNLLTDDVAPKTLAESQAENAALLERLAQAEAERDAAKVQAKAKRGGVFRLKVSQKGAVSVYGLQRWPVTLYHSQWTVLLSHADEIREFMRVNADALTDKE